MTPLSRAIETPARRIRAFRPSDLYKVRRGIASSGEHFSLLVDACTGLPVVDVNTYILTTRRNRCQSSTLETELHALGLLLAWARTCGLDLDELLRRGKAPAQAELSSLVDALRTDYRPKGSRTTVRIMRPLVTAATWARRIVVARDFVAWRLANVLRECEPGTLRFEHVHQQREAFIRAINGLVPSSADTSSKRGLEPGLWERLLTLVDPNHPGNPFHAALRSRNDLIIRILGVLGLRKGELLKLRTSHAATGIRPSISVERRPDDPTDPRSRQPQVKTRGRKVPLDEALARLLQAYIVSDRRRIPNAKRSPFLFLSRSGQPLSIRGLDKIFAQIIARYPEFAGVLTPHVLRHSANDVLAEMIEKDGCNIEEATEIRNYLMGWSPTSQQGAKYARRHIEARAQEISLEHQRRIFREEVTE